MAINIKSFAALRRELIVDVPGERGEKIDSVILDFYPDRATLDDMEAIDADIKNGAVTEAEGNWRSITLFVDGWDLEAGEGEPLPFTPEGFAQIPMTLAAMIMHRVSEAVEARATVAEQGKASRSTSRLKG